MHDQVRVGVGDGLQHVEEETETGLDPQRVLVAIAVDALTVHVLEDEIRLARSRHARIDEVRDVRVGEPGENVAFAPESLFAGAAHQRDVQQLDRRASFEAAVASLRQPHAAHPALTDTRRQPVGAEGLAGQRHGQPGVRRERHGAFQKTRLVQGLVLLEQQPQIGGEGRVSRADGRQPGRSFLGGDLERLVQVRTDGAPAIRAERRHGTSCDRPRVGDRAMQIEAAFFPVALHGPLGDAAHGGDLGEGEAAEELQIDDLGEAGIDLGELVERIADLAQLLRVGAHSPPGPCRAR